MAYINKSTNTINKCTDIQNLSKMYNIVLNSYYISIKLIVIEVTLASQMSSQPVNKYPMLPKI